MTTPKHARAIVDRASITDSILFASGRTELGIRAGTVIQIDGRTHAFDADTPVAHDELKAGHDYGVGIDGEGKLFAEAVPSNPLGDRWFAGYHFAPGGCAMARAGGDTTPSINPFSLWDLDFRFAGPDPRGMALIDMPDGSRFWADIYLLGVDHSEQGTSRFDVEIADGDSLDRLNFHDAVSIMAAHGKRLLTYDEFRIAALGVTEESSAVKRLKKTSLDPARTSRFGLIQATGNRWVWATDGDPDKPRPSILGGSWFSGGYAGSRYANLGSWPGGSDEILSARGGGDHLNPA